MINMIKFVQFIPKLPATATTTTPADREQHSGEWRGWVRGGAAGTDMAAGAVDTREVYHIERMFTRRSPETAVRPLWTTRRVFGNLGSTGHEANLTAKIRRMERGHRVLPSIAFTAALLLALTGQWLLTEQERVWPAVICYLAAIALFLLPFRRWPTIPFGEYPEPNPRTDVRPLIAGRLERSMLLVASAAFAFLAARGFADNRLDGGWLAWLLAIACFAAGCAWRAKDADGATAVTWRQDRRAILGVAALGGISLLAFFFRIYRLDAVPPEMTSDHAEKLLDVYDVLQGARPIFFVRNTGREAMQFYLTAALIQFTPLTITFLALKAGTAIVSLATVPLTYLLARQEYGRLVGLLAAFFLAISTWHVAITRVGLRFPFTAAFAAPAVFFLLRAMRHNRRNDWLLAGAVLGIGLHTYTAMRIVPLLFLALIGIKLLLDLRLRVLGRDSWEEKSALAGRFWLNAALGGAAAMLFFLPLLRYMVDEPESYWYRALSRSAAVEDARLGDLLDILRQNVFDALLMFNWRGDQVPINTIPGSPVLGLIPAALFVLGAAFLLYRLLRRLERRDIYLLTSFAIMLLPSVLSLAFPQENPSVVRTGGAIPFVMIIVSLPVAAALKRLWGDDGQFAPARLRILAGLCLLLALAVWSSYRWYFVDYAAHTRYSLWNATQIGEAVRTFTAQGGEMEDVYHIPFPHWVDTRNIAINSGDITWHNDVTDLATLSLHSRDPATKLYLVHPADDEALAALRAVYPVRRVQLYDSGLDGRDFWLFVVPAR